MGHRIAWIARRGRSADVLSSALGLAATGERDEFLDVGWYLLDLAETDPKGWTILIADGTEQFDALEDTQAQGLSEGGHETIYFCCSDTVMSSEIVAYRDGDWLWSVEYESEDDEGPTIEGDAPAFVHELERKIREQQRVEDESNDPADILYGLPAAIGQAMTGFNHDPWPQPDEDPFEGMYQVLTSA